MPRPEQDAAELAQGADGRLDLDRYRVEYDRIAAERQEALRRDARATYRALEGWARLKGLDEWVETIQQADFDAEEGFFLLDRLGADRYLDPPLAAMLLVLRRRLIDEHGARTAAELMIIDSTVLAYYHQLRINGWIGNLAQDLESEFFGTQPLSARLQEHHGTSTIRGLRVEEIVGQIAERLLPLLDRSNRMLLRNLKALRERRQGPAPNVNIGQVGQVNLGTHQINTAPGGQG